MRTITVDNEIAYENENYPNYFVTKSGEVYSIYNKGQHGETDITSPHKLAYGEDKDGYYRIVTCYNGNKKYVKIHTLVTETFISNVISPNVINHIDGNKHNNNVSNLEIVSVKENTQHAHMLGLCSQEQPVIIIHENKKFFMKSLTECMQTFPDLSRHYLNQLKNGVVLFSMILFEKTEPEKRISKTNAYYNGSLYKTFDSFKDSDIYFGRCRGSSSSAFKYCEYRKKINKYKAIFPNVSTIENTLNTEVSRVHYGVNP